MPEGDTIFRTAASLDRALAGQTVSGFETALAPLATVDRATPIAGRTIDRCTAVGKHVLLHFSGNLALRTHMRMSGSWHLYRPGEPWRRSRQAMRVRIDTEPWVAVAFDVHVAEFLPSERALRSRALSRLGPDLLSPTLDRAAAAIRIAHAGARPIADVLLDQTVVAGIGNVFKSEVLFDCGVHPDRPAASLGPDVIARLVDRAVALLGLNTGPGSGGEIVTHRGLRRTTGRASPADNLWVYGRVGKPCRRCGARVQSLKRLPDARATYWCPVCQPIAP
jgi:endonuclease-8